MIGPTESHSDNRMDRYVRNELTAAEARKLAQESLDAPELFEELIFSALAKSALTTRSVPRSTILPFPRKARWMAAGAAAAAAIVLVSLYSLWNPPSSPRLLPALSFEAKPGQPLLLATGLHPQPSGREEVFRGAETARRSPQPSGTITSIQGGLVSIDLGSLDGLAKGSELQVFRADTSAEPAARLIVTTVFRERARGQLLSGQKIQVSDHVRVSAAVHVGALLEQAAAFSTRGDSDAARNIAERAAKLSEAADVPAVERRKALERLAALEYQAGLLQAAEMHYRSAADSRNGPPAEDSAALNNLAVLYTLRGDYKSAEATLRQAVSTLSTQHLMYGRSVNNLAVLAELRGDRRNAEKLYADALLAFAIIDSSGEERAVVETNLARVRGSH